MRIREYGLLLLLIAALAAIPACATGERVSPTVAEPGGDISRALRQAEHYTALGQYAEALMLYAELYDSCKDGNIAETYIAVGKQVREKADRALQKRDFAHAGSLYSVLLESRVTDAALPGKLSFDNDYLKRQLKTCSQALLETGLIKYRDEKLDEAIAAWEKILAFDPGNKTILKAIDTANRQRNSLKRMP
ncbi:MAG: hypothetical protein A2010_02200 [Nitrospirae bacterium GWD2_57_9]|nr:MAG: hypothetical protein A2010_02200 [Nitrospirae bacterium GWD2_57_9]OGW45148.1 MAG: hypothetical protein A2078_11915 [Nitrospirae bacterium GWC2_57_9]